eukprot:scpid36134/ scgid10009/ 
MLLYVEGTSILGRTFVVMCDGRDTVARIKAKLLHSLNDWGKSAHQFRLRYKSCFLQDAVSLESQGVGDSTVIQMIPLTGNDKIDGNMICSKNSLHVDKKLQESPVMLALQSEVSKLERRSLFMQAVTFLIYFQLLIVPLLFATNYWWSALWSGVFALYGFLYMPQFYYVGGVATVPNVLHFRFIIIYSILSAAMATGSLVLWIYLLTKSERLLDGCKTAAAGQDLSLASDSCSSQVWFSALAYPIHVLVNVCALTTAVLLGLNLRFKIGDKLESVLLELRDIAQWIAVASSEESSSAERYEAAAQINSFVGTSDDGKFQVVQLGGLQSLINLSLTVHEETQELAVEALTMMLQVPTIQNVFVEKDGITSLGALLRSDRVRVQGHAAHALSLVVADNAENASRLAAGTGLSDVAFAMSSRSEGVSAYVADILNHMIAQAPLRSAIRDDKELFSAMVREAVQPGDVEELTSACLRALGIIAMETPSVLQGQDDLIPSLLSMPQNTGNLKILLPTAQLLLCYAEEKMLCPLLPLTEVKQSLALMVSTRNQQLLHLILEIVNALSWKNSETMASLGFNDIAAEVLQIVKENMAIKQDRAESKSLLVNVDTRAEYDKEAGTGENNPALEDVPEGQEDDVPDGDGDSIGAGDAERPLLGASRGADDIELKSTAQRIMTTLSLQSKQKVSIGQPGSNRPATSRRAPTRKPSTYSLLSTASHSSQ